MLALLIGASPLAAAASCGSGLRGAQVLESANYVVAYRFQPPKIAVGRHFALGFVTCAKGIAPDPVGVAVDAFMPEHGHGMNYRAVVTTENSKSARPAANQDKAVAKTAADSHDAAKAAGSAHFRADGLMFHMPGRWDIYFDVQSAGGTERLTHGIVLE